MGFIPPPLALTLEEFDKRWTAGARTFEELDPAFCSWNRCNEYSLKSQIVQATIIIAVIGIVTVAFLAA